MYTELHAASAFSFLEGASSPEALVERAARARLSRPGAARSRWRLRGAPLPPGREGRRDQGHRRQRAHHPIGLDAGEFRHAPPVRSSGACRCSWPRVTAIGACAALITRAKLRAAKGEGVLTLDDLDGETGGLIALVGRAAVNATHYGVGGLLDRVVGTLRPRQRLRRAAASFPPRPGVGQPGAGGAGRRRTACPLVATNGVRFASEDARPLFDVLTCARHGTTVERAGTRLAWNAERFLKPR